MKVPVKNLKNEAVGEIDLDDAVFGAVVRPDVMHRMVNYQLAKRRAGTHKTKGVSEISGRGKKPWRQKGTGRARHGSTRGPQWRGGATVFGPVVRSHAHDLPKKVRKLALRSALAAKLADEKLIILDEAKADSHKTKEMAAQLSAMGVTSAVIVEAEDFDSNFIRAVRNIPLIETLPAMGANVYDILRRDYLVITKAAAAKLEERLK